MSAVTATKGNVKLNETKVGDIFSEQSHYSFLGKKGDKYQFAHLESGNTINLDEKYVTELLQTADQYHSDVEVGIEDKKWTAKQIQEAEKNGNWTKGDVRVGDVRQKGILSIWNDIHSQQVFTVNFNKANTELSNKALEAARETQLNEALNAIASAAKAKKGVAMAATEAIKKIQQNPVIPIIKGDERKLRGYKTQFDSINGVYTVIDMDITTGMPQRQVNVREINWLVFNGVKYIVK